MVSLSKLDYISPNRKSLVDLLNETSEDKEIFSKSILGERYTFSVKKKKPKAQKKKVLSKKRKPKKKKVKRK